MTKPTIVIAGAPEWQPQIEPHLDGEYAVVQEIDQTGYVIRLTDARAALILVDGSNENWRYWVTAAKANNATRRIPVVLVGDQADRRREGLIAGADVAVSTAVLAREITGLVSDYARVETPARIEQLDCECQESLPALAAQGVEKFNAGEYYEQHDLFEALWVETEGPVRDLYRAILQVGVAYYQIKRGNHPGALKMLLRSVQWLLILPDECQGVDVKQLRADSARVRAELERTDPADIQQFDHMLLKPIKLVDAE